jgi:serralysin
VHFGLSQVCDIGGEISMTWLNRKTLVSSMLLSFFVDAYGMTFPEFIDSLPRTSNGDYIYDYDIATMDMDVLYQYYEESMLKKVDSEINENYIQPFSAVKVGTNGNDVIWKSPQKDNLTYCVAKDGAVGFMANYSKVANTMSAVTKDWENIANVNFKHTVSEDGNCLNSSKVIFKVLKTWATWQGGTAGAVAFFPDAAPENRVLWIAADMPENPPEPISFQGLLRHEVGHILGLVHEHARTADCPESGWRALTGYDRYSVMHYRNDCGGPNVDYYITNSDKAGIQQLYPFSPVPSADQSPPIARLSVPDKSYAMYSTLVDGSASNDVNGQISSYVWSFGDGVTSTTNTPIAEHVYKSTGTYRVSLAVRDNDGLPSAVVSLTNKVIFNRELLPGIYGLLMH